MQKSQAVAAEAPAASTMQPQQQVAAAAVAAPQPVKRHIADTPITRSNWYKHVNWLNVTLIILVPLYGVIAAFWTPLQWKTALWSFVYYYCTGMGITAGYHRLWAHTSYKASTPLQVFLAFVGAGAVEGSIRWWARDHRAHHRYTDTDKDPYSVRKGLLYSHLGWMVLKQNPKRIGRVDISDLNENAIVKWQHKNYLLSVIVAGLLFPCGIAALWGDLRGGLIYAGILRIFFVQQATFCVNSLAHWLGDQPFDDKNSPRDHVFTALMTLGEGYHNFHHEFPSDYRNALEWWQYDPTKNFIWTMKQLGLASDLKEFRASIIEAGRVQQLQKKVDQRRAAVSWGVPLESLDVMEWDDYVEQSKNGRALIAVAGVIHDVTDFVADHPGGRAIIKSAIGKDATASFNGGVYGHSNAAHNLLAHYRIAILRGGLEVEIWKQSAQTKDGLLEKSVDGTKIVRAGFQVTKVQQPIVTADAA